MAHAGARPKVKKEEEGVPETPENVELLTEELRRQNISGAEAEHEETKKEEVPVTQPLPDDSTTTEQHPSNEFESVIDELVNSANALKETGRSMTITVEQWKALKQILDVTSVKVNEKIDPPIASDSTDVQPSSSQPPWRFHKHGVKIRLTDKNTIAYGPEGVLKSVVFSENPMEIGQSYKVRVESIRQYSTINMAVGVTWTNPTTQGLYTENTSWASQLKDSLIINVSGIVHRMGPLYRKKKFQSSYGKALETIKEGTTVEIKIDNTDFCLHLKIDGTEGTDDSGKMSELKFNDRPCWAVFDVRGRCERIRIEQ